MRGVQFPLRELRYPSGLRVIAERDTRSALAGVFLVVGVGSMSDPVGKEGLAHYVEHLTFRSRPYGKQTIWSMLERAGAGHFNAETRFDSTVYYELGPASSLPDLLRLEGARMLAPVAYLAPEALEAERSVVRNEQLEHDENGFFAAATAAMRKALFPAGHPYSRPSAGTGEGLASIGVDDINAFTRRHYRPENMTLVVLGNVDLTAIDRAVREGLPPALLDAPPPGAPPGGGPTPGASSEPRPAGATPSALKARQPVEAPPPPPGAPLVRARAAVEGPELWVGWSLPGSGEGKTLLLDFVRATLQHELEETFEGASDVTSFRVVAAPGVQGSMLLCRLRLRRDDAPEQKLGQLLERIKAWQDDWDALGARNAQRFVEGLSLPVVRQRLAVWLVRDAENLVARGRGRALSTHFSGDPSLYARKLGEVKHLKYGAAVDYVRRYVTRERARAVLFSPPEGTPAPIRGAALPAGAGASSKVDASWGEGEDGAGHRPVALPATADVEATPIGASPERLRAIASGASASSYRQFVLPNGLRVVLARRDGLPIASLGLLVRGGVGEAPDAGSALLASKLAVSRRGRAGSPASFGGELGGGDLDDGRLYRLRGAAGNVHAMVAILAERARSVRVDSEEWPELQKELVASQRRFEQKPEWAAFEQVSSFLYAGSPRARPTDARSLQAAALPAGEAWLASTHTPQNAVLAVVGEIDVARVETSVRDHFGVWRQGPPAPPAPAPIAPSPSRAAAPRVVRVARPGAKQARIDFACLLPPVATSATLTAHQLSARLLEDRLRVRLRDRLGVTYGFHVHAESVREGTTTLSIKGSAEAGKLADALGGLRDAMTALANEGPSANELDWAKRRAAQGHATSFMTNDSVLLALLVGMNNGFDEGWVDAYADELAQVSPASVRAEFEACAGGRPTLLLSGEPALVQAAVKAVWPEAE